MKGGRTRRRSRSWVRRLVLGVALLGVGVGAARYASQRIPQVLRDVEWFQVRAVTFEGLRFAEEDDLRTQMALGDRASVWDDLNQVEYRLELNPLVTRAVVRRNFPSTLVVQVEEAEPVALIATPTLAPIDRVGELLPIDPARHRLDLPILRASLEPGASEFRTSEDLRILLREWVHLRDLQPELAPRVSQVGLDDRGTIEVKMFEPDVTLRYTPPASLRVLEESARVAEDALARRPGSAAVEVDMRFGDQILVRYPDDPGSSPNTEVE